MNRLVRVYVLNIRMILRLSPRVPKFSGFVPTPVPIIVVRIDSTVARIVLWPG